jgi:signal transduction histidine kinase
MALILGGDTAIGHTEPALAICRVPENDPMSVTLDWASPHARALVRAFLPGGERGASNLDLSGREWSVVVETAAMATRGVAGRAAVHHQGATLEVTCTPIDPPRALLAFSPVAESEPAPDLRGLAALLDRMEGIYMFQMTTAEPARALWAAGDSDRILGVDVKRGWDLDQILRTVHPEDHAEYLRIVDEPAGSCVYRVIRPDGQTGTLSRSWCTTHDQGGAEIRNGIVLDITSRERLMRELRRSNRDLDHFAAAAAHELQSAARTIAGLAALIAEDLELPPASESATSLTLIQATAGKLQAQVRQLLGWARALGEGPSSEPVDLNRLLAGVVETNAIDIGEAQAIVEVEPLPWVTGDSSQLQIVFNNLVSNACKYRDDDRALHIKISALSTHGEVLVGVTDTGTGFDMRLSSDVFALFRRVHAQDRYPGTGMGLAICRRIVEAHGGQITTASKPGVGSTFTVRLPLHTPGGSAAGHA